MTGNAFREIAANTGACAVRSAKTRIRGRSIPGPLFERAERLTNPALDYLNALERGEHIEELIERYAALHARILTGKEQL